MVIILLAVDWRFGLASLVGIVLAFVAEFIGFGSGEMKENMGKYTNFLFLNQSGLPKTASCYESMFQGLVRKYNKHHKPDEALPNITPHTMRHTFCTRLAQAGMNPKDLQYIMGHSNITMTLNYYAHADYASAKAAMDKLAA